MKKENGFFEYRATVVDCDSYSGKGEIHRGIVYADCYGAAVNHVEEYYGEELVKVEIAGLEPIVNIPIYDFNYADEDNYMFNIEVEDKANG